MYFLNILIILYLLIQSWSTAAVSLPNERILIHPFSRSVYLLHDPQGTPITEPSRETLMRTANSVLAQRSLNSRIKILHREESGLDLVQVPAHSLMTVPYEFAIDGFRLCQYHATAVMTHDGKFAFLGTAPSINLDNQVFSIANWPDALRVRVQLLQELANRHLPPAFQTQRQEACLWLIDRQLKPVWKLELEIGAQLYSAIVSEQSILYFARQAFDATGKAHTYPHNILDAATQEYSLRSMTGSGYLENKYFVTEVADPFEYAQSATLDFSFDPATQSSEFAELSLFTNANRMLEWLESLGYSNFGSAPIHIAVHASFSGDSNNALFQPGSMYSTIYVGDGDGSILQNLATDADVVIHELSHHVIYHKVTNATGESLVLHEGLADFFTFAFTGNACLGESVCPDTAYGRIVCAIPRTCLRTAENNYNYADSTLPTEAHKRSQFLSGLLWDLYSKHKIELDKIARLVLQTIEVLVDDSGYQDFAIGMLLADHELFNGKYCPDIKEVLADRGLAFLVQDTACLATSDQTEPDVPTVESTPTPEPAPTTESTPEAIPTEPVSNVEEQADGSAAEKKKPICGALSATDNQEATPFVLLVLAFPPMVALLRRSRL